MLETPPIKGQIHHNIRYRADIDGLRAVAVLPVVFFHIGLWPVTGGFVGVDIFFVISGYLITATIVADIARGQFSFAGFFERRIRRIFPALFVMAVFCAVAALVILPPNDFIQFGKSLLAMSVFVSNLFFRYFGDQGGYFDTHWEPQLFLHTWSLSVEEQFYILLPPGLMLLSRFAPDKTKRVIAILCVASFALAAVLVGINQKEAFFNVLTRAWELLFGTLLALRALPPLQSRPAREAVAAAGIALIAYAVFGYSNLIVFPGPSALAPCLGALSIIYAGESGPTVVGRILSLRPFVFVGAISYSLYLWHWPFVVFAKRIDSGSLSTPWMIAVLVCSLAAATLSWRVVERPFRGRAAILTRQQVLAGGGVVCALGVAVALVIVSARGFPDRFDRATQTVLATNFQRQYEIPEGNCSNWRIDVRQTSDMADCRVGVAARNILVIGDSQADGLRPLIQQLYDERALSGRGAVFAISAGCPPSVSTNTAGFGYHCNTFFQQAFTRAAAPDIDIVFIAFAAFWDVSDGMLCRVENGVCGERVSRLAAQDAVVADLRRAIVVLKAKGKRVIIALPSPIYSLKIPVFEINQIIYGAFGDALRRRNLIPTLYRFDFLTLREKMSTMIADTGAESYDLRADLCQGQTCVYQRGKVSIYVDTFHLARSQIGIYHDSLGRALQ